MPNSLPEAEFQIESLFNVDIPACHAVTSIGECLNYLFDPKCDRVSLIQLFYRVYNALKPGAVFIFDIVEPGQVAPGILTQGFTEGEDWVVLVEKLEDREQEILTRRIITFRKVGEYYRRDEEIHRQQLYQGTDITEQLRQVGFEVQTMRSYGEYTLPKSRVAFISFK